MATLDRVECPRCGRDVAAQAPAGGDGSALRIRPHNGLEDSTCEGAGQTIGAPGF